MKILEILEGGAVLTIKAAQAKKPSKANIKSIASKRSLTPQQARIQSLKQQAQRAKEAVNKERTAQQQRKDAEARLGAR